MNKYLICFLAICLSVAVKAQGQTLREDYRGVPYQERGHIDAEGTPFLSDTWITGRVTFVNGKIADLKLKYNIYNDELLFQKQNDSTVLAFADAVKSFTQPEIPVEGSDLTSLIFVSQFPPVDGQTANTFYQLIGDGKVKLLRHYKKVLHSQKAFNSATTTQSFAMEDDYYLFTNNQMTKIKPSPKTILAALSDKTTEVGAYIKTNKVNFKSDAALAKLFAYYSSL